jgi:ring-1,2-phenylacetyl-CoA epoxidase subunit PaaC
MTPNTSTMPALAEYALRLGDDALILAQRLGEWISNAPQIEEDIALGNIALDLLGQARSLLTYAGEVEGKGRTEDDLAYLRDERQFRNVKMVELPNGDFAFTIARQLLVSAYQVELYSALQHSTDATLAGIAAKAIKEVSYHRDHATQWMLRLGDGTEESHRRVETAMSMLWPYKGELFDSDDIFASVAVEGIGVDPSSLKPMWKDYISSVCAEATVDVRSRAWKATGGRRGVHTEHMGYLLAEMQYLHRSHPGATW